MNELTHIDLYTGIGGFSLAARANGVRTVVMCEADPHRRAFLERAWPAPVEPDVCKFDGYKWPGCWLLTAGTPCQPASRAGKQRGAADDRWLWDQTIRVIAEAHPRWALLENPPGLDDVGLGGIISELERLGYEVGICSIPACAVNSPQDRERYWIIAGPVGPMADCQAVGWQQRDSHCGGTREGKAETTERRGFTHDAWHDYEWLRCPDNSVRRVPVGFYELANGLPARIPRKVWSKIIAALGDSICWPIASEIIGAMIKAEQ